MSVLVILEIPVKKERIEDFFTHDHEKKMKTFVDFKLLLEENKSHTPVFLSLLARPLYQLSFLRYRLLNYFYKKAEFMAGSRWGDLQIKQYLV